MPLNAFIVHVCTTICHIHLCAERLQNSPQWGWIWLSHEHYHESKPKENKQKDLVAASSGERFPHQFLNGPVFLRFCIFHHNQRSKRAFLDGPPTLTRRWPSPGKQAGKSTAWYLHTAASPSGSDDGSLTAQIDSNKPRENTSGTEWEIERDIWSAVEEITTWQLLWEILEEKYEAEGKADNWQMELNRSMFW